MPRSSRVSEMKETSATARLTVSGRLDGILSAGVEPGRVGPLHAHHASVLSQRLRQLSSAHVESIDTARAALQEAVGEAPGGGAHIEADASGRVDPEGVQRAGQLLPSP